MSIKNKSQINREPDGYEGWGNLDGMKVRVGCFWGSWYYEPRGFRGFKTLCAGGIYKRERDLKYRITTL